MAENLDRLYLPIPISVEGIGGVPYGKYITDIVSVLLMDVAVSYIGARYTRIQRTHVSPFASEPGQFAVADKD